MVVRIEKLAEMITPPEKHEESRRKAGDVAVDIARADLSFGYPPPPSRPPTSGPVPVGAVTTLPTRPKRMTRSTSQQTEPAA